MTSPPESGHRRITASRGHASNPTGSRPCAASESPQLKVNIKSLAAEATIIRREELRHKGPIRASLHNHRVHDVRDEQRASLLAYGFLRGRMLNRIEPTLVRKITEQAHVYATTNFRPSIVDGRARRALLRAERIAEKFGGEDVRILRQRFAAWIS